MLKCQLHCHTKEDEEHGLRYSAKELLLFAKRHNFDVISITNHKKFFFNKEIKRFANNLEIILIPGIEIEIDKKHIIILNASKNAEKIRTFQGLKKYKHNNPKSFIMAPHPFFPGTVSLKNTLNIQIELFDGIEYSYAYTKIINFNKKAQLLGKKYEKPIIATADVHSLKNIDTGFTHIKCKKNIPAIISALKKNKIKNFSHPQKIQKIIMDICLIKIQDMAKKFSQNKSALI